MNIKRIINSIAITGAFVLFTTGCVPSLVKKTENKKTPASYATNSQDSTNNTAKVKWKDFFKDDNLRALVDSALKRNQELNIILQEINIAQNEVRARKGAYLPFLNYGVGAGIERSSEYTRNGTVDNSNLLIDRDKNKVIPENLPDYMATLNLTWQVDIWKQLRNAKKSALMKYLSTTAGKNFMVTHLIAEIANSYYELLALDNQLEILKQTIEIQQNALEVVTLQKKAGLVTDLAVRRFQAEVSKNQAHQFIIQQAIVEAENRINFLTGRFPQHVERDAQSFTQIKPDTVHAGVPSQLLQNRPDVIQAEFELAAAKLDVKVAKAYFYPTLNIDAAVGLEAFNPAYLVSKAGSMLYSLAGGLAGPLINRNAIKATYYTANNRQIQAVYNYERTILQAYIEVANQLANMDNLGKSFDRKTKQVEALTRSINIAIGLFKTANADYVEVLLTQRDALEAKMELVETKKLRMNAMVNMYQALGGGWN